MMYKQCPALLKSQNACKQNNTLRFLLVNIPTMCVQHTTPCEKIAVHSLAWSWERLSGVAVLVLPTLSLIYLEVQRERGSDLDDHSTDSKLNTLVQ